jgi:hypothetical protein
MGSKHQPLSWYKKVHLLDLSLRDLDSKLFAIREPMQRYKVSHCGSWFSREFSGIMNRRFNDSSAEGLKDRLHSSNKDERMEKEDEHAHAQA